MMYLDRDWKPMLNRDGEPYRLFDVKKDPPETEGLIGRKEYGNLNAELKSKLLDSARANPGRVSSVERVTRCCVRSTISTNVIPEFPEWHCPLCRNAKCR